MSASLRKRTKYCVAAKRRDVPNAVVPVGADAAWVMFHLRNSHVPRRTSIAAQPPAYYGGAAGAATTHVAGLSLAPRKQGSAHPDNRRRRCPAHPDRSTATGRAR